jgi:hypothetical protein
MKTELQKQLEQAEMEKIRAIDRVKEIKAQIEEAEKEPSIFELMPIGSIWCGFEVLTYRDHDKCRPVVFKNCIFNFQWWPTVGEIYKLITEHQKLDAMKKAADAALYYIDSHTFEHKHLMAACRDYRNIIEQGDK